MKLVIQNHLSSKLSWLILLLGLLCTGLAGYQLNLAIELEGYRQFAVYCDEISAKITARLNAHKQIVLSSAALFDASQDLTRLEWHDFVQRLLNDEHFKGIQGLGFLASIQGGQLAAHQQGIRAEGFPDYAVTPEGKRDAYAPIVFLEPFTGSNMHALGYDMYSEPVRRAAMEQARDQNQVSLSGKVTLIQETHQNVQAGTLMYAPVYQKNKPIDTLEQRRAALFGWVFSPFRMEDFLEKLVSNFNDKMLIPVHLRIYDGNQMQADKLLYDNAEPSFVKNEKPSFTLEKTTSFNGTVWTL